jgi:hypothetical protein
MSLWLVSLDYSLPNIQAYVTTQGERALDAALLARCIKTCEALVAFALLVGGKPSRQ